jgi:hypothetical protein
MEHISFWSLLMILINWANHKYMKSLKGTEHLEGLGVDRKLTLNRSQRNNVLTGIK